MLIEFILVFTEYELKIFLNSSNSKLGLLCIMDHSNFAMACLKAFEI